MPGQADQDHHGGPWVALCVFHRFSDGSPQHHAPVVHTGLLRRRDWFGNHAAAKEVRAMLGLAPHDPSEMPEI